MNVVGHKQAEEILFGSNLNAARSFLIEGPKGVGKALMAQKFAGQYWVILKGLKPKPMRIFY
jgi:MoxR-like ATPase